MNSSQWTNAYTCLLDLSRRHILGILFALFTGLFIVAPQLIFIADEGKNYKGLYMMMSTESEWYYLARMHEFYDEGKIGNPYLFEHKFHGPIFISPGGETILAAPGKLLDISIPTLNLIYKFLLPAITFLLLYALIFRLTASVAWSIAGALMFLVGSTWLYANNLSHFLRGDASFFTEFVYNRAVHPQFDGVLTFLYLNVFLSALRSRNMRWFIVLSALLGLSFYTYFYSFTFFLALNFVATLLWFYFSKKKEAFYLVLATVGGLLIGALALWAIYEATIHVDYPQITAYSTTHARFAEISKNGLIVLFLFIIYLFRANVLRAVGIARDHALFLLGLLITTFVVVNQQLLTGISLHSGHYHHNFNIPVYIITLMFLASMIALYLMRSRSRFTIPLRTLPWILSVVFIATGTFIQYYSYTQNVSQAKEDQRFIAAFSWLSEHTPKDSVVMANQQLSELIPIYTKNNVMWTPDATNYLMPPERVRFTPSNLLQSDDFFRDIKQFRMDYILWDRRTDPGWNIDRLGLTPSFSSEDLMIYKLP